MLDDDLMVHLKDSFPVVAGMSADTVRSIQRRALRLRPPCGAQLFGIGADCPGFAMLTAGTIRVVRPLETGRSILLYRVRPGESCIVSIASLLGDTPCIGRAIAEDEIQGVLASPELFRDLIEHVPRFRSHVFEALSSRLGDVIQLLERVTTQSLHQRVAAWLLEQRAPMCTTHGEIADELGTVREVVSRILGDFDRQGLVRLARGSIEVLNASGLEEITKLM